MRYAGIGLELAAAVALFTLAGWWVDGRFGTAPWGVLVGAGIGLIGGMYNLVRAGLEAARGTGGGRAESGGSREFDELDNDDEGGGSGASR